MLIIGYRSLLLLQVQAELEQEQEERGRKYQKLNWEKSRWLRVDKSKLASRPRNGFSSLAAAARWRGGDGCSFPVAPKVRARWNLTKMGGAWGLPIAFSVDVRILDQTTAEK